MRLIATKIDHNLRDILSFIRVLGVPVDDEYVYLQIAPV
jgi:hypothetical protein